MVMTTSNIIRERIPDPTKVTFDQNKATAQLLGRYQPWHAGHRALFTRAFERVGQVAVLVRSQEKSSTNPYSYTEVKEAIEKDLERNGYIPDTDFVIIQVPNITDITTGRDVGYTITAEVLPEHIEKISATDIRKRNGRKL
jgi:nicotinamide mononucleotide adenylyltransferase